MLTPEEFARLSGVDVAPELRAASGVSFHSARVRPGDAFFALPGAETHGLLFAEAALEAGAAFIVSNKPHERGVQVADPAGLLLTLGKHARKQIEGAVVGITGSAGKTSTKGMLAAALHTESSPGNFNTPLALASVLVEAWLAGRTAPSDRLVLELGIDHPGEMATLLDLVQPTHAVLTLIAESHLSALGDVKTVAREKGLLVDTAAHAWVSSEAAPHLRKAQRARVTVYGLEGDPHAEVTGRILRVTDEGQVLSILGETLVLPYPGAAMARNAVVAMAMAKHFGLDLRAAAGRLETVRLEPGRLQRVRLGPLTLLDDTYNSNPASARGALEVLRSSPEPHIAVLGDMLELGEASEGLHRRLGEETRGLDRVLAIGSEAQAITRGNPDAVHFGTLEEAIDHLKTLSLKGTVLLKASRGMRFERLVTALKEGLEKGLEVGTP